MKARSWADLFDIEKTNDKEKKKKHTVAIQHRPDAEWLTLEICNDYFNRAKALGSMGDVGQKRVLREELREKCDLTELEAVNILNGQHFAEYVRKYDIMQGKDSGGYEMSSGDRRMLDSLAELEEALKNADLINEEKYK